MSKYPNKEAIENRIKAVEDGMAERRRGLEERITAQARQREAIAIAQARARQAALEEQEREARERFYISLTRSRRNEVPTPNLAVVGTAAAVRPRETREGGTVAQRRGVVLPGIIVRPAPAANVRQASTANLLSPLSAGQYGVGGNSPTAPASKDATR